MEKSLNGRTLVWAHRGASAYAPENTLPAFALAAEMKVDGIELDVHLSKDGEIIVCHNDTINDTSDKQGKIREMTLAEIKEANFAYRYGNTKFEEKYGFVPAPTLDEVYELMKPTGLTVNVEIKGDGDDLVERCVEVAKNAGMSDRVYYSSFDFVALTKVLKLAPEASCAPLYSQRIAMISEYAQLVGFKAIHPAFGYIYTYPDTVRLCHEKGIRVNPWTVDGEADMERLAKMGVDALITDLPDVARKVLDGLGQ